MGTAQRGTGILNNELYVGRLDLESPSLHQESDTGPSCVAAESDARNGSCEEVPELRIITDELWENAEATAGCHSRRVLASATSIVRGAQTAVPVLRSHEMRRLRKWLRPQVAATDFRAFGACDKGTCAIAI